METVIFLPQKILFLLLHIYLIRLTERVKVFDCKSVGLLSFMDLQDSSFPTYFS